MSIPGNTESTDVVHKFERILMNPIQSILPMNHKLSIKEIKFSKDCQTVIIGVQYYNIILIRINNIIIVSLSYLLSWELVKVNQFLLQL